MGSFASQEIIECTLLVVKCCAAGFFFEVKFNRSRDQLSDTLEVRVAGSASAYCQRNKAMRTVGKQLLSALNYHNSHFPNKLRQINKFDATYPILELRERMLTYA